MYIKKVILLGSEENSMSTEDVFGISGDFNIDSICGTLSFSLPYYIPLPDSKEQQRARPTAGIDSNRLKKFDTCKLYFEEFPTDPGEIISKKETFTVAYPDGTRKTVEVPYFEAGGKRLKLIFDGFIDTIKLSKTKTSISYEIGALGTLGMSNYRSMEYAHKEGLAYELIQTLLQISGLQKGQFNVFPVERDLIPSYKIRFFDQHTMNLVLVADGGTELKSVLESLTNKFALIIHQSGDGYVNVMTPFFLLSANRNEILNINAWKFDINNGTLFEIDYGDLTNHYNAVVVLGIPGIYGVAVDPIAVELNGGHINYIVHENRNLSNDEDCQRVARDKLLEISRNFVVTIRTKFSPELMVGQPFNIIDNDRFDGTQTLILKKYSFTIDKNDVSCTIQGYANTPQMIPEHIAISPYGVLDTDVLELVGKETDIVRWDEL